MKNVRTSYRGAAVAERCGAEGGMGVRVGWWEENTAQELAGCVSRMGQERGRDDSDSDEDIISPSLRKDRNMQQGSKELTALPRSRWLVRRSSSGAISSGNESLLGTPTGLGGQGGLFYF